MATAKTIMRKTHGEAVVKVAGTAAAETISLANDLLPTGQALDGDTQAVNIIGVTWTGASDGIVSIARNGVVVMTLQANAAGQMDFGGQMMIPDSINQTKDIVVTISGAQAECWLKLRKVSGYKTLIQPEQFGSYDDPTSASA